MSHRIDVIVPTLARKSRAASLWQAIDTIVTQEYVHAVPLVVVNGNSYDRGLLAALEDRRDIRVLRQERADLPSALNLGVRHVDADLYAFLDDDDELLPGALASRAAMTRANPRLDVVVSNGFRRSDSGLVPIHESMERFRRAPLYSLLEGTWLASCSGLYRASRVGSEYFATDVAFLEWTYLAFRLARTRRVVFLDHADCVVNSTPDSLSASEAYLHGSMLVLRRMMREAGEPGIKSGLRRKYAAALKALCERELERGSRREAMRWYVLCLTSGAGLRYWTLARHLARGRLTS